MTDEDRFYSSILWTFVSLAGAFTILGLFTCDFAPTAICIFGAAWIMEKMHSRERDR